MGIHLLHELSTIIVKKDIGLYRDESLIILRNVAGRKQTKPEN